MRIPFDIKYRPQIESGEYKLETECGHPASIMDWEWIDRNEKKCLAVKVLMDEGFNIGYLFDYNGKRRSIFPSDSDSDLFIVTPEPELTEFEERIFKLLRQYKECDIPLTPENIKAEASMLWPDFEKYFFDLYGRDGEGDSALRSFYYRGLAEGKAEALRTRATWLTKNLAKSGLDKDSIPYHLIEFMCNLYDCQNWKEIEETAELYVTRIKAAAMKDLPRWEKDDSIKAEQYITVGKNGERFHYKGHSLLISNLTKLPGFKED